MSGAEGVNLVPSTEPWKVKADSSTSSWKLGSVPVDQNESSRARWLELESAGVVVLVGSDRDGGPCEVAVDTSYLPYPIWHELVPDLRYNPLSPDEHDIAAHGQHEAVRRAETRFLDNAARAIRSGRGAGCEHAYLVAAQSNDLGEALEGAILRHDVQVMTCHGSDSTAR